MAQSEEANKRKTGAYQEVRLERVHLNEIHVTNARISFHGLFEDRAAT